CTAASHLYSLYLHVALPIFFSSLDIEDADSAGDDTRADRADRDTPLEQSGLSARALSALSRLEDVVTVGDLLGVHPNRINFQRGDRKSTRLNSSHVSISYAI